MKMNSVCQKTGLTERTIRFYIERGLIHPCAEEINERMNYDFSGNDVEMLKKIAALRKTNFSIDDILEMERFPEKTDAILRAHVEKLKNDSKTLLDILSILDPLQIKSFKGIHELGAAINKGSAKLSLPATDIRPNFARFDNITDEERQKQFAAFEASQKRSFATGRVIVLVIAIVNVLGSIVSAFIEFNLISLIVSFILSGALVTGVTWVRYLFASGAALSAIMILALFIGGASIPPWGVAVLLANLVFSAASSIVLFTSKSVGEFLYAQKNG